MLPQRGGTASLTSDSAQADYSLQEVTQPRTGSGGRMTLCLEYQANAYGIVRDVGTICPLTHCRLGLTGPGCYMRWPQTVATLGP